MNLYITELKQNLKTLIYYSIGVAVLIGAGLGKGSGMMADSEGASVIIGAFPKSALAVFGMYGMDISTLDGFYGILFFYFVVIALIYAAFLGASLFSKEEVDHTSEFLYVKPLSRASIFITKFLVAITLLFALTAFNGILSQVVANALNLGNITSLIISASSAIFLVELMILAMGMMFACVLKQAKRAGAIASFVVIASYIFSVIIDIAGNINFLSYLTPTRYIDIVNMVNTGGQWNPGLMICNGVLLIIFTIVAFIGFKNRDMNI